MKKITDFLSRHEDKLMHFTVSLVITLVLSMLVPVYVAAATSLAVGLGKEWYDMKQDGNHWCWWDILADVLGVLMATVPLLLS